MTGLIRDEKINLGPFKCLLRMKRIWILIIRLVAYQDKRLPTGYFKNNF